MDRARAFALIAIATAVFHLLAAFGKLPLPHAGQQQPAAPATHDHHAAAMAVERLLFVAAHLVGASSAHTPLPRVGSGPGADGTTTNSQEQLAAMQASLSLPELGDHNEPSLQCVVNLDSNTGRSVCLQRYKWRRLFCALAHWPCVVDFDSNSERSVCLQRYKWRRLSCALLAGARGTDKEFEALEKSNIAKTQLQEALDVLLRSATGNSLAPAPATKRAAGVNSADNCNIKNRLELHAMKGGRKILPDSVNRATRQTHLDHPLNKIDIMEALHYLLKYGTKMEEKNGGTKLQGAARKMAAA